MSNWFGLFLLLALLGVIIVLIGENRHPVKTLAWIMVLVFLPVAGLVLYLFFGTDNRKRRLVKDEDLKDFKSYEQVNADLAIDNPQGEYKDLQNLLRFSNQSIPLKGNALKNYTEFDAMFADMLEDIRSAKDHIHIEFFKIEDDAVGRALEKELALKASRMIFDYLPRCYNDGSHDPEAREKMANAATMAGMAFANAFLGVCHSMAHKLGAFHHLPHGVANALLIEEVIRFNSEEVPAKMGTFPQYAYPHTKRRYAEVAESLNLGGANDDEKVENLIAAVHALKQRVGIKDTIRDYGVDEEKFLSTLDEMVEQAFDDQCTGANPRYPLMSEIKEMYLRAYYGK